MLSPNSDFAVHIHRKSSTANHQNLYTVGVWQGTCLHAICHIEPIENALLALRRFFEQDDEPKGYADRSNGQSAGKGARITPKSGSRTVYNRYIFVLRRVLLMPVHHAIDLPALIATADPKTEQLTKGLFSNAEVTHRASSVLKAAQSAKSEIIIMDLNMPGIVANDMIQRLKAMDCSVIVISSENQISEAGNALRMGALDYVVRPFTSEDLRTRIAARLQPRNQLRQFDEPLAHLVEKLHDPDTGRLDAQLIAQFFGFKVAELARILDKRVGTVSKTSNAPALQDALRPLEVVASGLLRLLGSETRMRIWLQAANPALDGHAPIELLQRGKITELAEFVQDLLEGRPA